jgi:hypothetical protein
MRKPSNHGRVGASASAPAHFPTRVHVHARPGTRIGIGTTPAAGTVILTAVRRLPYAGPHHEIYTVRRPARIRVLDPPSVAVVYLARGGLFLFSYRVMV